MTNPLDRIHKNIMWNRLIAVVEEEAQALIRTSFSTSVREAGDLAAAVFDRQGRMLAQAVTGTPGHINSVAECVKHFLAKHPIDTMDPGDTLITNDPWLASGHHNDITIVTPVFFKDQPVGLMANTCHVVDIGGRGFTPDGRQIYEEGLNIPILHLARQGEVNQTLVDIIRMNVREADQVVGDMFAFASGNRVGADRLIAMMQEFGIDDLEDLSDYIITGSREATIQRIAELAPGTYHNSVTMDGYERPITLQAALMVTSDEIHVDYDGTSPASSYGINVVLNYTRAYTTYGVKCVVAPDIPNNAGSLEPITVSAPEGSILNVQRPSPVALRHIIGHLLPDTVIGALAQIIPERVIAEGSSALANLQLRGGASVAGDYDGDVVEFEMMHFNNGGTGARPTKDGLSATGFPNGVRGVPVEATEAIAPIVFWRKELRTDSGGAGTFRGGLGQVMELGGADGMPFDVLAQYDKAEHPARGRFGGLSGAPTVIELASGSRLRPKGQQSVPPGDRLVLSLAGGGGFGDPFERDPELVAADVAGDYVTVGAARELYGVVLTDEGTVDEQATADLRDSTKGSGPD